MEREVVKTHDVKIAGRTFTLAFPLRAMLMMQRDIEGFDFNELNKLVSNPDSMLDMLYILADNGARLKGGTLDVDKDWFALHIPASLRKLLSIRISITETLADGMNMEAEEDDEHGHEVDVVLQEIQKKRDKTD